MRLLRFRERTAAPTATRVAAVLETSDGTRLDLMLEPGDVILTGTPAGVGVFRDPPVFLRPGDVAAVEVEALGRLSNPIVDAVGRAPDGSPAARLLAGLA